MPARKRKARAYRLERSHRKGCLAFASASKDGGGPFFTFVDRDETTGARVDPFVFCNRFANPNVTRGRYQTYIRFRCNDLKCRATALVHIDTALRAIGLNLEASRR
jgi:hypothetical protein